jgi:hypothetical protein
VYILEFKRNPDLIKIIFKMKDTEKKIINISNNLRSIKVQSTSISNYKECINNYNEGSCYFFESCGFLKSQYFSNVISYSEKEFLLKNLLLPANKRFLSLNKNLSLLQVEDNYINCLTMLKENLEEITYSIFELQKVLNNILKGGYAT